MIEISVLDENQEIITFTDIEEWIQYMHDNKERFEEQGLQTLARDTVGSKWVSTILIPISMPGHQFETIVFEDGDSGLTKHWGSIEDARIGHANIVKELQNHG